MGVDKRNAIESMEIAQKSSITRRTGNICIQACINNSHAKAEQQHCNQYNAKRKHQTRRQGSEQETYYSQYEEAPVS